MICIVDLEGEMDGHEKSWTKYKVTAIYKEGAFEPNKIFACCLDPNVVAAIALPWDLMWGISEQGSCSFRNAGYNARIP